MSILVRLIKPYKRHKGSEPSPLSVKIKATIGNVGGRMVRIGKPREPSPGWDCGTDIIFPVEWIEGFGEVPNRSGIVICVCRHQIEAGD